MSATPLPEMSEDEFNAKLAKNVAESAAHMKTLEKARRDSAAIRESNDAVDDLRRLREVLMEHVERTGNHARGVVRNDELESCDMKLDPAIKCIRLARAVRQTVVLQQEVLGLRPAPGARMGAAEPVVAVAATEPARDDDRSRREDMRDRENLHDRDDTYDYDDRPYEEVIASIRETFKIPADAKPVAKRRAAVPAATFERHVAALAGAAEPGAYRREHGPP
jgi:hypothetical protein